MTLALAASLASGCAGSAPTSATQDVRPLRVVSEQTATGFAFPESVAYDPGPRSST